MLYTNLFQSLRPHLSKMKKNFFLYHIQQNQQKIWESQRSREEKHWFSVCKCTLAARVELLVSKYPKSFSAGLVSILSFPSLCWYRESPRPTWMTLHWPCWTSWGSHGSTSPACQGPPRWIPSLKCLNHTTQLGVVGKLAQVPKALKCLSLPTWT